MKKFRFHVGLVLFVAWLAGSGCQSTARPGSGDFASVIILGRSSGEIREAAQEVFLADQYVLQSSAPSKLVFDKRASALTDLAYGGWFDDGVWLRVKVSIEPYGSDTHLVSCQAFRVSDHGEALFEGEQKLSNLKRGPYQKMLQQIADKLR